MYVAVKGGERAIDNAHRLLAHERRGDPMVPELTPDADRAAAGAGGRPSDGGRLAVRPGVWRRLPIKQSRGDLIEAIFLVRAYRTTLPRFGVSAPVDTDHDDRRAASRPPSRICPAARCLARPSTTPIGCSTSMLAARHASRRAPPRRRVPSRGAATPRVTDLLGDEGLIEREPAERRRQRRRPHARAARLSRRPRSAAAGACARRRGLSARARLFDAARLWPHPPVRRRDPASARSRSRWCRRSSASRCRSGAITLTECQMVNQFKGSATSAAAVHARLRAGLRA